MSKTLNVKNFEVVGINSEPIQASCFKCGNTKAVMYFGNSFTYTCDHNYGAWLGGDIADFIKGVEETCKKLEMPLIDGWRSVMRVEGNDDQVIELAMHQISVLAKDSFKDEVTVIK